MTLAEFGEITKIVGVGFAGVSCAVGVATFIRLYLQKQGDALRDLLFDCERDFDQVYREFDQRALLRTASEVIEHPRIAQLAKAVFDAKDKSAADLKVIVESHQLEILYAVVSAISGGESREFLDYNEKYRLALSKLRPRYPLLHFLLADIYGFMAYSVGVVRKSDSYFEAISTGLKRMKEVGDLEKQKSPEAVLSLLFGIILVNLEGQVQSQKLNELFRVLRKLLDVILPLYRERSDFGLWRTARRERRVRLSAYAGLKSSEKLKLYVTKKQDDLGKEQFAIAATLVGNAEAVLTSPVA